MIEWFPWAIAAIAMLLFFLYVRIGAWFLFFLRWLWISLGGKIQKVACCIAICCLDILLLLCRIQYPQRCWVCDIHILTNSPGQCLEETHCLPWSGPCHRWLLVASPWCRQQGHRDSSWSGRIDRWEVSQPEGWQIYLTSRNPGCGSVPELHWCEAKLF